MDTLRQRSGGRMCGSAGWREHDAAAIAALYADGAFWQQHPFRDPEPGYLARVFAEEEDGQDLAERR